MAKYYDPTTGQTIEVGNPELNPELIKGKQLVNDFNTVNSDAFKNSKNVDWSYPSYGNSSSLSPWEQKAQGFYDKAMGLNDFISGKSSYKTGLEQTAGLEGMYSAEKDLTAQLQALAKQSKDLQNQYQYTIPNQMQEQAAGRGITTGGLAPIQAGELRKNQIQQGAITSQALTVGASLDAVQGNLSAAIDKIDRAVAAKFGPAEAEREAIMRNLELIQNSPEFTNEQKKRAQERINEQNRIEEEQRAIKENFKSAKTAVVNIFSLNPNIDAQTKIALENAKTPLEVVQIAQQKGLTLSKPDYSATAGSLEEFRMIYGRTPKNEQELNQFTASRNAAGRTPEKVDQITAQERLKLYPDLPASLIGQSETKINQDLLSSVIPVWFKEILPTSNQNMWDEFRKGILSKAQKQLQKTSGELVNPFDD